MMRKKQISYVALALLIFLPSFLTTPALAVTEGNISSKDEVVYGTLNANGELENIYVVNTLEVAKAGRILDYGDYSSVKNLTDLSELVQEGEQVELEAPEGKFYYQGNLDETTELPWDVTVTYELDGQKVDPSTLAGKSGQIQINIETAQNEAVDSVFYENYLLQISMTLPNTYQDIETSGGMIANAGKNKQITFTVMPGEEEALTVEAAVEDFEFQGVEIAAVPSTLPIDTSEMDNMTEGMSELSDGIEELHNGVGELQSALKKINDGWEGIRTGSLQYKNGIAQVDSGSSDITSSSLAIQKALADISKGLSNGSTDVDLSGLQELPAGLSELAAGLTKTAEGLTALQKNYGAAYAALDAAITKIPANQLTEEEIAALYESGANKDVLDKLVASHKASQNVKGTYEKSKEAFAAVEPGLTGAVETLQAMSKQLTTNAAEMSESLKGTDLAGLNELLTGLPALSENYKQFHTGLVGYTTGVSELAASYIDLHSGAVQLINGSNEMESGMNELHNGTAELHEETKDLPSQMKEEINQMISEYDKSDFEPVSFVSSQNDKVSSVQFVIKTESIVMEEQEEEQAEPEKEKGFWELFLDLFR